MKEKLEEIRKKAEEKIAEISDSKELNDLKVTILGKKGELTNTKRNGTNCCRRKTSNWKLGK